MTRFGIRARLLVLSLLLFGLVALLIGAWLESRHRVTLETQIESALTRHARVSAAILADRSELSHPEDFHHLTTLVGETGVLRVTLIAEDGTVIGDSAIPASALPTIENHGTRPEIQAVMGGASHAVHSNRRHSSTVAQDMLYVAVPVSHPRVAVVRVAMPLDELERQVTELRLPVVVATAIVLLLVFILAALGIQWITRDLLALVARSQRLAPRGLDNRGYGNEVEGLSGSFEAIATALRQAIEDQNARRVEFESVLFGMEEGVLAIDQDSRITILNKASERLLDIPKALSGENLLQTTGLPALSEVAREALDGRAGSIEFTLPSPDGGPANSTLRVRATPQLDGGALLVLRDVTELRRLERVRADFVANVSHELRTPVTAMQISAEALRDGALDTPHHATRFVDAILRNSARLRNLLADLLEIAAVEGGHIEIRTTPVFIEKIAEDAVQTVIHKAREKEQSLIIQIPPTTRVVADAGKLEQILLNYLDNAIKYTPPKGQITLRVVEMSQRTRIEIEDDGPGIPEVHRPRLFERFYRVDPGRSRDMGGTGLGLAIVRHLAELMGGRAGMRPSADRGSIFWVDLDSAP